MPKRPASDLQSNCDSPIKKPRLQFTVNQLCEWIRQLHSTKFSSRRVTDSVNLCKFLASTSATKTGKQKCLQYHAIN